MCNPDRIDELGTLSRHQRSGQNFSLGRIGRLKLALHRKFVWQIYPHRNELVSLIQAECMQVLCSDIQSRLGGMPWTELSLKVLLGIR